MDVSFNNVVESTRQYFQGVPNPTAVPGQPGYGSTPFWYQQGQATAEHHQTPSNRLPSLAPFSSLNYRGNGGSLQALNSVKSNGQGSYEVNASPARYPSPSGYGNYYGHQQQQQQQQQQHHQHHIQHQQSQQLQAQQQQAQIHQHQQQSHQHQQQISQHHQSSHQQQQQVQHHQQHSSNKEHQSQIHSLQPNQQSSQHMTQQSSQSHQSHIVQKHQALQGHQQAHQNHHSTIQSHQGHQQSSHQSLHGQQGQQVITNHHSQQQTLHHVPPNHQSIQQNYQDSQQQNIQSHSQMLQLQNHKQVIQNHKVQLIQNQPALHSLQQNHSPGQHNSNVQHQYANHQPTHQSHHSHQMAVPKYQMQNHPNHHSSLQNHHQPVISQLQPSQQINHQQPTQGNQSQLARQSPLAGNQQHMTRQSPHHQGLPSHHQQTITRQSPHISSHQQTLTRQSPHHQNLPSPSILQQQAVTRQSPLASTPAVAFPSQPSNHSSGHQQGFFSTNVSGSRTTPTGSAAIPVINQVKRESPLDLSVKTIRQSADSTADPEHVFYTFHNEFLRGKASGSGHGQQPPLSASKVDFQPFTIPADGKRRKEAHYSLPSVNSFSRAYDKIYQQPTQQQLQRSGGLKAEARYSQNYLKRPPEPEKQQAPPKVPRIDTWKQTFDQQIEKRFNSYLSSIAVNGEKKIPFVSPSYPEQKQNGADKRVLSILRNSLETRNQQVNHAQPKPPPPAPRYLETRLPPSTVMRQNLPPFGALSGDRNRLQVPRAVDSIQRTVSSQDVVDITDDDEPPQQASSRSELDGLAAFLAARIRTKAELKQQVTPNSKENSSKPPPTPSNASCSSGHSSPRTPVFSSVDNKDLVKNYSSSEGSATGNRGLLWSVNAHRLSKETSLLASLPRRRDSDSEGSDVALNDLRRGSILSSSLVHSQPPPLPDVSPEDEEDFNKWIALCDELVIQLQQGGKSIRKRFKRRLDESIFIKKEEEIEELDMKIKKESISDNSREGGVEDEDTLQLREKPLMNCKKIRRQRKPGPRKKKIKKFVGNWQNEVWQYKKPIKLMTSGDNFSNWPKAPSSLPDLDRLNDPHPESAIKPEEDNKSVAKSLGEEKSFLDRLMQRYSERRKKPRIYEQKDPQTSSSELSSTPKIEETNPKTETIAGFRDDLPAEGDLPPDIKPKIKETKLKQRDFDEERPASAPPPGATKVSVRKNNAIRNPTFVKKKKGLLLKKGEAPRLIPEKRFKTFRRKLKSSGFDYIRKKKKQVVRKEGADPRRERKKKAVPLTEEEIQAEIKGWVLNKGLGETLLHRAARIGNVNVVYYCLEKLHHNPAPRDNAGYTPLHVACSRGHFQVANLLLKYGANVSDSALGGVRPLHEAAENGFIKIVKLLLEHGADPQLATYSGSTALALATDEEAKLLMEMHISSQVPVQPVTEEDPTSGIQKQEMDDDSGLASSDVEGFEIEESSVPLPNLYRLANEPRTDSWVLFHELSPLLRVKTKEALLKQLGQDARTVLRDMKTSEFYEKAHCRAIKSSAGPKTPKVTLVKYTDTVKFLLGVETTVIPR